MSLILKFGDRLPTVVALQILLNRHMKEADKTAVNGHFDFNTQRSVITFQRLIPFFAGTSGEVGQWTWLNLIAHTELKVLDAVDITDPDMGLTARRLREDRANPIVSASKSGSIVEVVQEAIKELGASTIVLLRFHGHGGPGVIGVSDGKGILNSKCEEEYFHQTSLDSRNVDTIASLLTQLGPYFAPFGSVELHGCNAGHGKQGTTLLRKLADIWNVPVSAPTTAQNKEFLGDAVYRFSGVVQTQFPGGGSLESWAVSQPEARSLKCVGRR